MRTDARGFRVIPAYATRAGVFAYLRADGSRVRELRHPDDVFDPKSVATLDGASVTDKHPSVWVSPENVQALETGHAGPGRRDSIYLATDLSVRRADMIKKVDSGEAIEASCGYSCDIVAEAGEYEGQRYDQRQTNIVYNHIGLGPKGWGRAGAEVRLRMDSAAAVLEEPEEQRSDAGPEPEGKHMIKIRVDGKDYELAEDAAALVSSLQSKADGLQKAVDTQAGRADAAESKIKTLEADLVKANDPKTRADAVAALVAANAARVALEASAVKVLGSEFKADGKSDREVRVAAIAKLEPEFKVDGKSDDYVSAVFDRLVAPVAARNDGLALVTAVVGAAQQVGELKVDGKTYDEALNARASHNPFAKAGN